MCQCHRFASCFEQTCTYHIFNRLYQSNFRPNTYYVFLFHYLSDRLSVNLGLKPATFPARIDPLLIELCISLLERLVEQSEREQNYLLQQFLYFDALNSPYLSEWFKEAHLLQTYCKNRLLNVQWDMEAELAREVRRRCASEKRNEERRTEQFAKTLNTFWLVDFEFDRELAELYKTRIL
ncbi:unnamed protein product [Caenorhabditis sp. 36 PRJEB53466]|nr:unnamed protein product [Caenorhabditis sp. 36 PRJEB53466]